MKKQIFTEKVNDENAEQLWQCAKHASFIRWRNAVAGHIALWICGAFMFFGLLSLAAAVLELAELEKLYAPLWKLSRWIIGFIPLHLSGFWDKLLFVVISVLLLFSAAYIISLIIEAAALLCMRDKEYTMPAGIDAAERAKLLGKEIKYAYYNISPENSDSHKIPTLHRELFAFLSSLLLGITFCGISFYFLKKEPEPYGKYEVIGAVACSVILFLISWWLIWLSGAFAENVKFGISKLRCWKGPVSYLRSCGFSDKTEKAIDDYWVQNDPEEHERREKERREREEAERKEALRQQALKKMAELNEERGMEFYRKGKNAERSGNYSLAENYYKQAADLGNPDGSYNYARISMGKGRRSEAIRYLKKAMQYPAYNDAETRRLLEALESGENINIIYQDE